MPKLRVAQLRYLVPFLLVGWVAALPLDDNSFLWHVRAGTVQLDLGRVLTVDPFSFTEHGAAWRTQSWLVELGYGWLENLTGGIAWVPLMKLLMMGMTLVLVGLVIHRVVRGHELYTLVGLLLLAWQQGPFGVARPALVGYLLLAVTVAALFSRRRPLWLLPPLFWLWASIHGSFPVGLGLVLLDAIRRKSRRQATAAVIAGLATAATAHGLGVWWILVEFFQNRSGLSLISEWRAPAFSNPFLLPLLLVIIGLIVAGVLGRLTPPDLWVIVPFVVFGVIAERNVWPAFIVLLPFAMSAFAMDGTVREANTHGGASAINGLIGAVLLVAVFLPVFIRPFSLDEERFPSDAAIAALSPGPQFNGTAVGGYLIYEDWPRHEVFIDDRAELYGGTDLERFGALKNGVGIEKTFGELGISQAILGADWPVVSYLELLDWEYRYRDDYFVVMGQ